MLSIVPSCFLCAAVTWDMLGVTLKAGARSWFVRRAEQRGVPWKEMTRSEADRLDLLRASYAQVLDQDLEFPDYYTLPFHGYDEGNLCWNAAFESAASTLSMSSSYWKDTTPPEAARRMRHGMVDSLLAYEPNLGSTAFLDVGCSVGISLNSTISELKNRGHGFASVYGLDLSAYFLSVARVNDVSGVEFIHANAEAIPLHDAHIDCVAVSFVMHELPPTARANVLAEIHRILRPNGTVVILDLDPFRLVEYFPNPWRRWAFEATEPHISAYYGAHLDKELLDANFVNVKSVENDPLNSVWLAQKETDY